MTSYMFPTVFPSIIRSSRLYTQQQAFVKQILLSAVSVHHQEFKTVHTTDTAVCLLASTQQYLFDK